MTDVMDLPANWLSTKKKKIKFQGKVIPERQNPDIYPVTGQDPAGTARSLHFLCFSFCGQGSQVNDVHLISQFQKVGILPAHLVLNG